jgi:hypothetical protein
LESIRIEFLTAIEREANDDPARWIGSDAVRELSP